MRLTKERVAVNRQKILSSAERLFRLHGVECISIADIMKDAGFTHGGFYNHFDSKDELVVEVYKASMDISVGQIHQLFEGCCDPKAYMERLQMSLDAHLASERSEEPNTGNGATAMLAMEATRQGLEVQKQFCNGMEQIVGIVAAGFAQACDMQREEQHSMQPRERAIMLLSGSLGALVMARGMMKGDPALADEFLVTGRNLLLATLA